eukprot:TRINITY_DN5140_c0_g1_i13.p2 TRINITY_DN5140_c0_g1~~TRINITY_DN5140_c0_g1_i13.p2  ORF type:complete len:287 (+),score=-26.38 TRINITY_DN5140_c0_g1_i13:543-1403(+)
MYVIYNQTNTNTTRSPIQHNINYIHTNNIQNKNRIKIKSPQFHKLKLGQLRFINTPILYLREKQKQANTTQPYLRRKFSSFQKSQHLNIRSPPKNIRKISSVSFFFSIFFFHMDHIPQMEVFVSTILFSILRINLQIHTILILNTLQYTSDKLINSYHSKFKYFLVYFGQTCKFIPFQIQILKILFLPEKKNASIPQCYNLPNVQDKTKTISNPINKAILAKCPRKKEVCVYTHAHISLQNSKLRNSISTMNVQSIVQFSSIEETSYYINQLSNWRIVRRDRGNIL